MRRIPAHYTARLGLLTVAALVSVGCLRMIDEPSQWPCNEDADCPDDERCAIGVCFPKDHCFGSHECGELALCLDNRCTPVECTTSTALVCAPYRCDSRGSCYTSCSGPEHCAPDKICYQDQCVTPQCDQDTAAEVCRGYACQGGVCRADCVNPGDCFEGFDCEVGRCVMPSTPDSATSDVE